MKPKESRLELGRSQYQYALGLADMKREEDGFIHLHPTAKRADEQASSLTTSISSLEAKLEQFRKEKAKVDKFRESDEYKESKKKEKNKKFKKQKQNLLDMVFNNADHIAEEAEENEDEENYKDSRKKRTKSEKKDTTLDTTYGKRFSPVVSMLHDTIHEFDKIASGIQDELDSPQLRGKSMYRSSQISNLISAKNSKLSAVKELAAVATTISNLEYKKDKDRKAEEGSDTSKAISMLGAKYLRGGFETKDERKAKKDKKRKKYDDDDDDVGTIKKSTASRRDLSDDEMDKNDRELASQLAKALGKHDDIKFTAAERFIDREGTFNVMIAVDPDDKDDWKFVAVDPKTKKIIPNFKDDYPGLLPKKKNARIQFDFNRLRGYDKESGRTYHLLVK